MSAGQDLLGRYTASPPAPPRFDDVVALLVNEYRAYAIPLYSITVTDYTNDPEVDEGRVATLLTITHPATLASISTTEDLGRIPQDDDWIDELWRVLWNVDVETEFVYGLLLTQQQLGQRTSIMLEREGDFAVNFKVYGHKTRLIERLTALIGLTHPWTHFDVQAGRGSIETLDAPTRVEYLQTLASHGMI